MSETTEVNRAAFGQFLNQLRREKGWTQKDLAERLYVSDKAVSKWERGLSLPDVALLLPLAGALGVSVTELLEGRRAVQEQRYSAAEVEALIRRALAFPVEPPERQQARVKRYLPVYLICCVLGVAEALAVWLLGLAPTEMGQTCLVLGVGFGVIYGAYAFFWMTETLPRYYDENRIAQFAQGAMHIHIPGVYYNNRNWPYVLRAFRVWSMVSMLLLPPCLAAAGMLEPPIGENAVVAVFAVYILSLFVALVWPAKKYEKAKIHKSAGEQNCSLLCCAALCYNRTKTDETGERTCSEIHRSTCADRWILPARSRSLAGTRRFPLPAMAAGTAAGGGRTSSSPGLICGGSRPVSVCRPAL